MSTWGLRKHMNRLYGRINLVPVPHCSVKALEYNYNSAFTSGESNSERETLR